MKAAKPAANPDAYVAALDGWRQTLVRSLRRAVSGVPGVEEQIKWGNLVYSCKGPAFMIRAEDERVLFGFWRGKRLQEFEPRLKAGGKYEMANLELRKGDTITATLAGELARRAVALNRKLGDPTKAAKPKR